MEGIGGLDDMKAIQDYLLEWGRKYNEELRNSE